MALLTDDIAQLFAAMRIAYGPSWQHSDKEMDAWRKLLNEPGSFSKMKPAPEDLKAIIPALIKDNPDFPPSLGRVASALDERMIREMQTKLPPSDQPRLPPPGPVLGPTYVAPPAMSPGRQLANQVMLYILIAEGGVAPALLEQMKAIKNAEANDYDEEAGKDPEYRKQFVARLKAELLDQIDHYRRTENDERSRGTAAPA